MASCEYIDLERIVRYIIGQLWHALIASFSPNDKTCVRSKREIRGDPIVHKVVLDLDYDGHNS